MARALKKDDTQSASLVVSNSQPAPPAISQNDSAKILELLQKLASDPNMSVERVDHAFTLYQRIEAERARRAYDLAFAAMQADLPSIQRNGTLAKNEKDDNGKKTGKQEKMASYALYADIMEAVQPRLRENGFGLSYRIAQTPDRVSVTCILSHAEGHREETSFALPIDTSGAKNNVQGWGSSLQYAKRYTSSALLNIVSKEAIKDDDDGKAAGAAGDALATISEKQATELSALIEKTKSNVGAFLSMANAESVGDVLAKDFEGLKTILHAKLVNAAKRVEAAQ